MSIQTQAKKGLTVKDLIVIGVFTAILSVCSMIGGTIFAVTPTLTFYYPIGAALLPGPVFLLLMAKVPKRGTLTIIGILLATIGFILGMHWAMCPRRFDRSCSCRFSCGTERVSQQKSEYFGIYCIFIRLNRNISCLFYQSRSMGGYNAEKTVLRRITLMLCSLPQIGGYLLLCILERF